MNMGDEEVEAETPSRPLRYGWTTGCCAAAAAIAATRGLLEGTIPREVTVQLPKGQTPLFQVEGLEKMRALMQGHGVNEATFNSNIAPNDSIVAGVMKDAGDDPDVTHGVTVFVAVRRKRDLSEPTFVAGEGVGTVTLPGLPLSVGEPAINPGPRSIIANNLDPILKHHRLVLNDLQLILSIPGGRYLATKTWNERLGIVGGLSVLGTTGVVIPYSCSAWIHSIWRGVDVAMASNYPLIGASTGRTSDVLLQRLGLPMTAIVDMGDFVGALCRYLDRREARMGLVLAMGLGKATKLAQGATDLRARIQPVDFQRLAQDVPNLSSNARRIIAQSHSIAALHASQDFRAESTQSTQSTQQTEGQRKPQTKGSALQGLFDYVAQEACRYVTQWTHERMSVAVVLLHRTEEIVAVHHTTINGSVDIWSQFSPQHLKDITPHLSHGALN